MKYHVYGLAVSLLLALAGCQDIGRFKNGLIEEQGDRTIVHGATYLEHEKYGSLSVNGTAELKDVKVSKELDVNGSLKAEDCVLKNVIVKGSGSFEECKVLGNTVILGAADFDDCTLKKVEVTGSEIYFEDSKVFSIFVKKDSVIAINSQKVVLKNTVVAGDVTFEQGDGIVVLEDGAKIKGNVVGGKIITN